MPNQLFALIIATVLIAGAVTAWAISATPATPVIAGILISLVALRLYLSQRAR